MKGIYLLFSALCFASASDAQVSQATINLFAKKSIPYESPMETYTDMYLEEGEATTVPFKELTAAQMAQITGTDYFSGFAYAVDQVPLVGKNTGLIVYQILPTNDMPYEEMNYQMYIIDANGKPTDNINISSDFFTVDISGEINISDVKTSVLSYGEFDDNSDRLFLEVTYDNSESVQADFGQQRSVISVVFFEVLASGKLNDVTVYLEE